MGVYYFDFGKMLMFFVCINYFIIIFFKIFDVYLVKISWYIFKVNILIDILLLIGLNLLYIW